MGPQCSHIVWTLECGLSGLECWTGAALEGAFLGGGDLQLAVFHHVMMVMN